MSECTHDCSTCSSRCEQADLKAKLNASSQVRHVIAVVSGKGGVGKSLVTSFAASAMRRRGYETAILDADITGPSIPRVFGVSESAMGNDEGILPAVTAGGIRLMSINLLLENDTDPVIWRGSLISGTVTQFWTDVVWGDVDYMFVDMPPGTGDVPLTVFQSLPVDGILVVTSPQELVDMIVSKAVKMARMMNVPVLGLVENMSYLNCPDCGRRIYPFGEGKTKATAEAFSLPLLCQIPLDPAVAQACDHGEVEKYRADWTEDLALYLEKTLPVQ